MTTYMRDKWLKIFEENEVWREQRAKIEYFKEMKSVAHDLMISAHRRKDWYGRDHYDKSETMYQNHINRAEEKLRKSEYMIIEEYNLINSSWDYSRDLDDEYFIERIDLDGYLRGTIL